MTKMSRRDYLVGMGATAGAIAGTAALDVFAQHDSRTAGQRRPKSQRPVKLAMRPPLLHWPITRTLPSLDAFVTVIFGGLMGFCYTKHDHVPACEIGFHKGGARHKRDFRIYKKMRGICSPYAPKPVLPTDKDMTLKLRPETNRGPDFYQTRDSFFDRIKGDAHDFRWLPDLHGGDFYPEGYDLHDDYYKTSLYVHDGTFYTRVKTNSTFKLVDKDNDNLEIRGFGHVAMYMAAGIPAQAGDTVLLSIAGGETIPFAWEREVSYQIVLRNECYDGSEHCGFTLDDPDEEKRNDFHFNRKVLKVPSGRTKLALMIDEQGTEPVLDFCPDPRKKVTDEAPCMGAGYGRGPGFP
jgi:hypothetical protein